MSDRIAKVNKLFKQEVGKLILEDVDFPAGMVVTVIKADTSADLHYGDIYISVMPREKEEEALSVLEEGIYAMQQKINKKLHMKPVPMVRFRLDLSGDKADRINEIIKENEERCR
ncbi:MAG: 30S ribosome-binding factor RbfA [Patescibacteria group bacterium]